MGMKLRYCLSNWHGYMEHFNQLEDAQKEVAVAFFRVLKQLKPEEVSFLSEKYLTGEKVKYNPALDDYMGTRAVPDAKMADKLGIDVASYTKNRVAIEKRANKFLLDEEAKIKAKQKENLWEYVLKAGKLYLKSFKMSELGRIENNIVFTRNQKEAHVFSKDDATGQLLVKECDLLKEEPDKLDFSQDILADDYFDKLMAAIKAKGSQNVEK